MNGGIPGSNRATSHKMLKRFVKSDISAICAEAVKKGGEEEWRDELYQIPSNRSQV